MLAIGQEPGPAVGGVFAGFEFRQRRGRTAVGVDAPNRFTVVRLEDDDIVLIPGTTAGIGRIRKDGDRTARCRDLFKLTVSEKSQKFSVRGPERKGGAFGAFEFSGGEVAEGLHPKRVSLLLVSSREGHGR